MKLRRRQDGQNLAETPDYNLYTRGSCGRVSPIPLRIKISAKCKMVFGQDVYKMTLMTILAGVADYALAAAPPHMIDLPSTNAFPESLSSTSDGTLYIGSVADGGIVRIKRGTSPVQWIKPGAFRTAAIFGVLADSRSHMLWACSNDLSASGVPSPSAGGGSVLVGFDLGTGEGKVRVSLPGKAPFCNDIAVGSDRSAYITNTAAGQILRLRPGGAALELWAEDPQLPNSLDGIAFGSDGALYVNSYKTDGFYRIAVDRGRAGQITKLKTARPLELADGMRSIGHNQFLMIEGAGRLDRLTVNGDNLLVEVLKEGFTDPTGVTVMGRRAWVSEGQLSFLFKPAKRGGQSLPFRLYEVSFAKP